MTPRNRKVGFDVNRLFYACDATEFPKLYRAFRTNHARKRWIGAAPKRAECSTSEMSRIEIRAAQQALRARLVASQEIHTPPTPESAE